VSVYSGSEYLQDLSTVSHLFGTGNRLVTGVEKGSRLKNQYQTRSD
jgi:hypothetical protein